MGSWNNTCGLTNLPIISGEEVYVFPIKERNLEGYRSHCYANALYDPFLIPFVAKYNDYGAGEDCTGVSLPFVISSLKNYLVEMEQGENQHHDIAVTKEGFDIDMFFEAIHEDRLFVKWGNKESNPVYFTMVRKDVVDRMWNEWTFDYWTGKGKGSDPNSYYEHNVTYAKLADQIPEYLDECISAFNGSTDSKPDHVTDEIWKVVNSKEFRIATGRFIVDDSKTLLADSYQMLKDSQNNWRLVDFKSMLSVAIENDDMELAKTIMRDSLIGLMVNSMMESTRRIWLPVMHLGSQSEEYAEYRLLHKIANDVISNRENEFED